MSGDSFHVRGQSIFVPEPFSIPGTEHLHNPRSGDRASVIGCGRLLGGSWGQSIGSQLRGDAATETQKTRRLLQRGDTFGDRSLGIESAASRFGVALSLAVSRYITLEAFDCNEFVSICPSSLG